MSGGPPQVIDHEADQRFQERARAMGWDPHDLFVGGYVDWEWQRSRHAFEALFDPIRGLRVLEFGCHLGATAIVLAALGAEVIGIDVDEKYVDLGQLNAERHGLGAHVRVMHVPDTTRLPFDDGAFDVVSCNSVLEYVPTEILGAVLREIDRVLRPGGHVVVLGTSNRLWPRDNHSAKWLVGYVPRRVQRQLLGFRVESVTPRELRAGLPGYADLGLRDGGRLILDIKARMGLDERKRRVMEAAGRVLGRFGVHPGYLSPTITMVLQKP